MLMRVLRATLTTIMLTALLACGDDDKPKGVGAGRHDAGPDAAVDPGHKPDATVLPPPPSTLIDAGRDAGKAEPPPPPSNHDDDEDAGVVTCKSLHCSKLNDDCNVFTCDEKELRCVKDARPDGTACGSDVLDNCSAPDRCNDGECEPRHADKGTPCGDQDVICHLDDACNGKGECKDEGVVEVGTPCGASDEVTDICNLADTCDASGTCQPNYAPSSTACGDQNVKCSYDDHCDGFGGCSDGGAWVPGACPEGPADGLGGSCTCGRTSIDFCHPDPDLCDGATCDLGNLPDGQSCSTGSPETSAACDFADTCIGGVCEDNVAPSVTPCSTGTPEINSTCDLQDRCDGGGNCADNAAGTEVACGVAPSACHDAPRCSGTGACSVAQPLPEGSTCGMPEECMLAPACDGGGNCGAAEPALPGAACGNPNFSSCDGSDECDGAGECDSNPVSQGTSCGSGTATQCNLADQCDGAGACDPHYASPGTACGDQGKACLKDDECNAFGQCENKGNEIPCTASLYGVVNASGASASGVDVEVLDQEPPAIATVNGTNNFTLDVPVWEQIIWYVEPSPGVFWGSVTPAVLTASVLEYYQLSVDPDALIAQWAAVSGLVLDVGKGIVAVSFDGAVGGEDVTLSASSAGPVAEVSSGTYDFVDTLPAAHPTLLLFFNVTPGTTTLSVTSPGGPGTCVPNANVVNWPVFARTVTHVGVRCE
jgi:hypothetical protein